MELSVYPGTYCPWKTFRRASDNSSVVRTTYLKLFVQYTIVRCWRVLLTPTYVHTRAFFGNNFCDKEDKLQWRKTIRGKAGRIRGLAVVIDVVVMEVASR